MEKRFPDATVRLTGEDGNAFAIMARVSKALRQAGYPEVVEDFVEDAMSAEHYDALLVKVQEWVEVE